MDNVIETPALEGPSTRPAASAKGETPNPFFVGVWFGLAVGVVEGTGFVFQHALLDRFVVKGPHGLWHSAVADVVIFGGAGLALWALGRIWRGFANPVTVAFVMVFLAAFGLLTDTRMVHAVAIVILSLGLAFQASRMASEHAALAHRWMRLTAPALAFVVAASIPFVFWRESASESEKIGELSAPASNAPNVVLVVLDTVRAKSMGLYGYERDTTPGMSEHAAQGVVFERAYVTAPWTLPSHKSMFTGRYVPEVGSSPYQSFTQDFPTLAEVFRDRGYATGGFVANVLNCGRQTGLARGFAHYQDHRIFSPGVVLRSCGVGYWLARGLNATGIAPLQRFVLDGITATEIVDGFLNWQNGLEGRPFFAFLNLFDAHHPYDPLPPFDTRFSAEPIGRVTRDETRPRFEASELDRMRVAYDSEISFVDQEVDRLFAALRERGLAENTIVILTSDHGELFGEHGLVDHGNALYNPLLHVPLVVVAPGRVAAGVRVHEPVSLRDLPATILDLARIEGTPIPGTSLRGLWDGRAEAPAVSPVLAYVERTEHVEFYPSHRGPLDAIVEGPHLYIRDAQGNEEVYDLLADPEESTNLVQTPEGHTVAQRLRGEMERALSEHPGVSVE